MTELLTTVDHYESANEKQKQSTNNTSIHIGINIELLPLTFMTQTCVNQKALTRDLF